MNSALTAESSSEIAHVATIPLLSLKGITKEFPQVLANDNIDLDVYRNEIHALLGENGAGKSTLMKILYGFYSADSGEILLNGKPLIIRSPNDARKAGIGMVFQDFMLIPAFTVAENIALFLPDLKAVFNSLEIRKKIIDIANKYDLQINPDTPVWQLSVGQQQKVEIVKLLLSNTQILILDEPTKVLAPNEVDGLFRILKSLRENGYAIIFITHKMPEVLKFSDRISILRQGKNIGQITRTQATESALVNMMFGEALPEPTLRLKPYLDEKLTPVLNLQNLSTTTHDKVFGLYDINLVVGEGQIVGVAGISGNGQKELGDAIMGLEAISAGKKYIYDQDATSWTIAEIRDKGVAFIPEDPLAMTAVPTMTILENMALKNTKYFSRKKGFQMDWKAVASMINQSLAKIDLQIPPLQTRLQNLSGGNVQRAIIAREMAGNPKLIIAFYPTRGLDVKSTQSVREVLMGAADSGAGVLLFSEDLTELFTVCDFIAIVYHSRVVGTFRTEEITLQQVGQYMTGLVGGE